MADLKFTPEDFQKAAIIAASKLGQIKDLTSKTEGDTETWSMEFEILAPSPSDSTGVTGSTKGSTAAQSLQSAPETPALSDQEERLIDKCQLAKKLNVSLRTLGVMISGGRVPAPIRPTGRLVRWRAKEIEAWFEQGCPDRPTWELK